LGIFLTLDGEKNQIFFGFGVYRAKNNFNMPAFKKKKKSQKC
jgi:hypothetical protein